MALTKISSFSLEDGSITADKLATGAIDSQVSDYLTTNTFATESYVDTSIANLVDTAPATLDTLNELAAALGDDPNFATTVTNSIATKLPLSGGTLTGELIGDQLTGNYFHANGVVQSGLDIPLHIDPATNDGVAPYVRFQEPTSSSFWDISIDQSGRLYWDRNDTAYFQFEPDGELVFNAYNAINIHSGYTTLGSTQSGAMTILGHNVGVDPSVSNKVVVQNTGYFGQMIKMYYSEGITFHATADTQTAGDTFYVNGGTTNELMRLTNDGKLGIGLSNPTYKFEISDGTRTCIINPNNILDGIFLGTKEPKPLILGTDDISRARIHSNGKFAINTTSDDGNLTVKSSSSSSVTFALHNDSGSRRAIFVAGAYYGYLWTTIGNTKHHRFEDASNIERGSISVSTSGTSYNTSSDYRLKENIVSIDNAGERVLALNPCRFNFIEDPDKTVDGFLAHEAQEVVPEAVTGTKDAMKTEQYEVTPAVLDDDGNVIKDAVIGTREVPDYQGIDQAKLVPLLTAALQEALTEIDNIKQRLTTLENN